MSTVTNLFPKAQEIHSDYILPRVWKWDKSAGGLNRPISGPTHIQELPVGEQPLQLYSMATPNGMKVTIFLEELLQLGIKGAEYDAWIINIGKGDQFGSDFWNINPNSKIPALVDRSNPGQQPIRLFESGSILFQLAEKFGGALLPKDQYARAEAINWLFWQMGSAPYLGGGFGHFYHYSTIKFQYPIDRFTMEVKRQLHVLDQHLINNKFMAGDEYSIADIAIWTWYGNLVLGNLYGTAAEFLDVDATYPNVLRWANEISNRPAVQRGRIVNLFWGDDEKRLLERHDASDFDFLDRTVAVVPKFEEEKKE